MICWNKALPPGWKNSFMKVFWGFVWELCDNWFMRFVREVPMWCNRDFHLFHLCCTVMYHSCSVIVPNLEYIEQFSVKFITILTFTSKNHKILHIWGYSTSIMLPMWDHSIPVMLQMLGHSNILMLQRWCHSISIKLYM